MRYRLFRLDQQTPLDLIIHGLKGEGSSGEDSNPDDGRRRRLVRVATDTYQYMPGIAGHRVLELPSNLEDPHDEVFPPL